jgi:hypothetical protein
MKTIWIACLTACASVALADEVKLTSGRTLVGIAHDEGDRWMVETRLGDIRVPKSEVQSMTPGRTSVHEYQERLDELTACPTADEIFELARWARDEGLIRYVNALLTRTIELHPDHREARSLLGFVYHEGQWMMATARDTLVEVQESIRRRAAERPPETARRPPPPEEAPYYLGIRLSRPPRSQAYGATYRGY